MVLKNKNILNILIICTLLMIGVSSYYAYLSSQKYTIVKKDTKLSSFMDVVESTLTNIASERIETAKYLATEKKNSLLQVKHRRSIVDKSLKDLETFIIQNRQYMFLGLD
jgi:hypothetical protein